MKLISVILLLALPCFAQTPNCAPAPSGLVGWWKGDGNALDSAGTNNGVLVNGAGFAPGEVGQGFSFTGPDQGVLVPDAPELDPTNAVSVEAWVLLTSYPNTEGVLVVYKNVYFGPGQYAVSVYQTGSNSIFQALLEVVPSGNLAMYGTTSLQLNTWYHVAITYDRAQFKLYVNGQLENSVAVTGPLVTTTGPLKIGGYGVSPYGLPGRVDEASVYNRALSSAEIQSIYQAGSAGKCFSPSITLQPQGQVGYWGASATFNVHANGSAPLAYLWYKDGFPDHVGDELQPRGHESVAG